ncbi:MAG: glutamate formimidoyltransferase [Gemmatimonadota bacterium]
MAARVLEAVPNFSEGRDRSVVRSIADAIVAAGADLLDHSSDPDHHRSVFTMIGSPRTVERAAIEAARIAVERIDLRRHRGVHPRIGALDVLPFVPLVGLTLDDARASARRVGQRLAELFGLPVYYYGAASDPPGRPLAELRRGGVEALVDGWPPERRPDVLPPGWTHPGAHPTAGAACVGARKVLLAWNVQVDGLSREEAAQIAREVRERDGGFIGVRALAFELRHGGRVQISMNVEDLEETSPMHVFQRIEDGVIERGGRVIETEVIGLAPDELVHAAAADRLALVDLGPERVLSRALARHLAGRVADADDERAPSDEEPHE